MSYGGEHHLGKLNKFLGEKGLFLPKELSCEAQTTTAGPHFTCKLYLRDYDITKVGFGQTKKAAKNDAARQLCDEIAKKNLEPNKLSERKISRKGPVSDLHELAQKHTLGKPTFQVISSPSMSDPCFLVEVRLAGRVAEGRGTNKKVAKGNASAQVLRLLKPEYDGVPWEGGEEGEVNGYTDSLDEDDQEEEAEGERVFLCEELEEFQGTVTSTVVSQISQSKGRTRTALALGSSTDLPDDLSDISSMTESQILIKETSDLHPVVFRPSLDWKYTGLLESAASQLCDIEVTFEKMKLVEGTVKKNFLCFLTIKQQMGRRYRGVPREYLDVAWEISLERACEALSSVALKQCEQFGSDLYSLLV